MRFGGRCPLRAPQREEEEGAARAALPPPQEFYHKTYIYLGKLAGGVFFDAQGQPQAMWHTLQARKGPPLPSLPLRMPPTAAARRGSMRRCK